MARRADHKQMIEMARKELANHVIKDSPVRAFRFHSHHVERFRDLGRTGEGAFSTFNPVEGAKFTPTSNWSFTLTWTPGVLALSGDLGELTLTHYSAMRTFEAMLGWVRGADYSYLMEKSDKSRVFDAEGTVRTLVEMANEPVLDRYLGSRHLVERKWVRSNTGFLRDFRQTRKQRHFIGPWTEDMLEDWYTDFGDQFDPRIMRRETHGRIGTVPVSLAAFKAEGWEFDECWHMWMGIWEACGSPGNDPVRYVIMPGGRKELVKYMARECQTPETAADFCHQAGLDDWHGSYDYEPWTAAQIEIIQHGCRLIDAQHVKETEHART